MEPTEYERITYVGRDIEGARELKGGYMGCGSLEQHCAQSRDGKSWAFIPRNQARWYAIGRKHCHAISGHFEGMKALAALMYWVGATMEAEDVWHYGALTRGESAAMALGEMVACDMIPPHLKRR